MAPRRHSRYMDKIAWGNMHFSPSLEVEFGRYLLRNFRTTQQKGIEE